MSEIPRNEAAPSRIALISSSYHPYPGGVEEHARNVARELRSAGHDVVVWTVDRGEHLGTRDVEGVEVRYLPTPLPSGSALGLLRFAARLPHALWRWGIAMLAFRPQVLHVQCFGPNGIYALVLHHLTRIPLVVSAHGETFMDEHDVFSTSRLLRWGLTRSLRDASAVTGCSTLVLEDLRHRFGLEGGTVVPNGVDPDEGAHRPLEPTHAPDGPVRIFALGRLVRVKGIDLLIRAFAAADIPNGSRLVIGGDGPELESLHALAHACGVDARCDFLGALDRTAVARQMDEATIAVVPSRIEAFGIVVLEVWRAGTPLIATRNGGPADIVTDGVDGLLVDPEDTEAFAATLERLAADSALRTRLGAAGRRTVAAYTWRRTAADYERIYEALPARTRTNVRGRQSRPSISNGGTTEPMTTPPLSTASVVIVTYNRPEYMRTCLEHLTAQTRAPVETVVVDASPDLRTRDVVADFPGVVYLRNDLGLGHMATSRAIGVAHVTGDVVAFIDDDAFAEPTWLAEILRRYTEPDVGAVGGRARNNRPGEESEGLDRIGLLLPDGTLTGNFAADPGRDVEVDHMLGANMTYRRDVLEQVGGIHDHFPGTCLREDSDTSLRIRRAGYRIIYTPEAVVLHVGGTYAKGRRFDARYQYYGARNHAVLLVHALGLGDPRTRRYVGTVARHIGSDLASAVRAPFDPARPTLSRKVRGVASGLSRAGVRAAGTAAGAVAAARLLVGGDRPPAVPEA